MLVKCKTKGSRVKGLAFHPRLHLLLASMHSGEIQLWDYFGSTLVEVFREHNGPARGIDFHIVQPLFVSGGDDTNVILWDFKQKKKLSVLTGHMDYVRTVQFHEKYPWILSASDDQTVRIWNWQSRTCICSLSGHNHYVMCARFHPNDDLIVSASLDHTARVWDISALREKTCSMQDEGANRLFSSAQAFSVGYSNIKSQLGRQDSYGPSDIVAITDVICKYLLNGHSKGVNWAIFHDTASIVVTASDDKTIRAWRYNGSNVWQTNILRGHQNNVCSLIMHPNNVNYLFSVSEDHTIKVWDTTKWELSHTFVMDHDRFWIISRSMNMNYIAAGHDSGLLVFKLFKERPIVTIAGNDLYYMWNDTIYVQNIEGECRDYVQGTDFTNIKSSHIDDQNLRSTTHPIDSDNLLDGSILSQYYGYKPKYCSLDEETDSRSCEELVFPSPAGDYCKRRMFVASVTGVHGTESLTQRFVNALSPSSVGDVANKPEIIVTPISLSYNTYNQKKVILLAIYRAKAQVYYEVLTRKASSPNSKDFKMSSRIGKGVFACFSSEETFVAVENNHKSAIYNISGDLICNLELPCLVKKVFPISINVVLFWSQTENSLLLFDVNERKVISEAPSLYGKLSTAISCRSRKLIAVVYRNCISIYDRCMKKLTSVQKHTKIKSAAWYENMGVIFSTSDQMHYLLVNGDFGVLCSISKPTYILRIVNNVMYVMERDHRCFKKDVKSYEFSLKRALYYNDIEAATRLVESGKVQGNAILSYLIDKGQASLARKIVKDPKFRLELALNFGNLQDAVDDAHALDEVDIWESIGNAALEQGNCIVAELSFQKGKLFDRLSFLYLITGNTDKLKKMLNVSKFRKDIPSTIKHALYLGDMGELANILRENEREKLADICEYTYGISENQMEKRPEDDSSFTPCYMVPPQPIKRLNGEGLNWPVSHTDTNVENVYYDGEERDAETPYTNSIGEEHDDSALAHPEVNFKIWSSIGDEDLYLPSTQEQPQVSEGIDRQPLAPQEKSVTESSTPLSLIAVGSFEQAIEMLKQSFGLCDSSALETIVSEIYQSSKSYMAMIPGVDPVVPTHKSMYASSPGTVEDQKDRQPHTFLSVGFVTNIMKRGFAHVTAGDFEEAITEFRRALGYSIFLVSTFPKEMRSHIDKCRVYILAMLLESERDRLAKSDIRRSLELAAYFTCCDMQPQHRYLVLRRTMGIMWKAQNYKTATRLVKRLLNEDVSSIEGVEEEIQKAKQIRALCEQKGIETHQLDFDTDDEMDLRLCTITLSKVRSDKTVRCRFCHAIALEKYLHSTCNICKICELV